MIMITEFLIKYWKQLLGALATLGVVAYISLTAWGFYSEYESRGKAIETYKVQVQGLQTSLKATAEAAKKCSDNTTALKAESDRKEAEAAAAIAAASKGSKVHEKAAQDILSKPAKKAGESSCKVSEDLFKSYLETYSDSSVSKAKGASK